MSFGFSISDFIFCGQIAYHLYTEFKDATGDCHAFAKELLLFHKVVLKTQALIRRGDHVLDAAEQTTLGLYLDMCKDILFVQIAGGDGKTSDWTIRYMQRLSLSRPGNLNLGYGKPSIDGYDRTLRDWMCSVRRKFEERNFAKKIPKLRAAISTVTEQLTSFHVLMIR